MFSSVGMNKSDIWYVTFNGSEEKGSFQKQLNCSFVNSSSRITESLSLENYGFYIIGSLMTVIMFTGFSSNFAILYTYVNSRAIRTADNTLIVGLALSDIGQAIFGVPFVAVSSFSRKWVFGDALCQFYAFITTTCGISQISMLTMIALERYFVIVRHNRKLTNTPHRCLATIFACFSHGTFWATGPLLGWSGFKEEETGIACCVRWENKDAVSLSYTLTLCVLGWLLPLTLIAFGYINIACTIYNERRKRAYTRRQNTTNKSNRERRVAVTTLTMVCAFIVSWTPYSIVTFWSAVWDYRAIPLWIVVAPAVFAKCSIIWNPIIYVGRHKQFRENIKKSLRCLKAFSNSHSQSYEIQLKTR